MRGFRPFGIVLIISLLGLVPSAVRADKQVKLMVQLADGVDAAYLVDSYAVEISDSIPALALYYFQTDPSENLFERLQADPQILQVQEDQPLETFEARPHYIDATGESTSEIFQARPHYIDATGDIVSQNYFEQWPAQKTRVSQAHQKSKGQGVKVAVIDTGIDLDHPALVGQLTPGYDFVDDDADPDDLPDGTDNDGDHRIDEAAGHGTHVAGIIALVAPSAQIMPVRVLNSDGVGTYFDVIGGIIYAVDHQADVINLSLSGTQDTPLLRAAIEYAWKHEVIVVAAAGAYQVEYPARYEHVLSVGATDMIDHVAEFSNFQAGETSVFAPGVDVYSTYYNGGYAWWTGTSMATPFVAGEAALLRALGSCDTLCTINTIKGSVRPVVPSLDKRGRIDLYSAVQTTPRNLQSLSR